MNTDIGCSYHQPFIGYHEPQIQALSVSWGFSAMLWNKIRFPLRPWKIPYEIQLPHPHNQITLNLFQFSAVSSSRMRSNVTLTLPRPPLSASFCTREWLIHSRTAHSLGLFRGRQEWPSITQMKGRTILVLRPYSHWSGKILVGKVASTSENGRNKALGMKCGRRLRSIWMG